MCVVSEHFICFSVSALNEFITGEEISNVVVMENSSSEAILNSNTEKIYRGSLFRYWDALGSKSSKYTFFDMGELSDLNIYRSILSEFVGTFMFQLLHLGIILSGASSLLYGISTSLAYWFLLLTIGPISGGHFNPLISLSTIVTGYTSVFRGCSYVLVQMFGGFMATVALNNIFAGSELARESGTCGYWETDNSSPGTYVVFEMFFDVLFLFFDYALAINARASSVFGPGFGSFLFAFSYGTLTFISKGFNTLKDINTDDTSTSNPQQYTGYTWSENVVFCVMSNTLYNWNDVEITNFAMGGGLSFGGLVLGITIHSLLHYALLMRGSSFDNQEEELTRNKMMLKLV